MPNDSTTRYLIYSRHGHVSGAELADRLGIPHGRELPDERYDYVVRWGTSQRIRYIPSEKTWNLRRAIANNSNKLNSLRTMRNEGVRVPNFSTNVRDVGFPCMGRGRSHMQGRDVQIYMQMEDIRQYGESDYYMEYIPKRKEYRVHVIDDEVVKVSEKRFTNPEDVEYDPLVWNYHTGWTFHHPSERHTGIYLAMPAIKSLDLDFGAVDMLLGEDGNMYVLEANTCPGLSESSLDSYERKFRQLLNIS